MPWFAKGAIDATCAPSTSRCVFAQVHSQSSLEQHRTAQGSPEQPRAALGSPGAIDATCAPSTSRCVFAQMHSQSSLEQHRTAQGSPEQPRAAQGSPGQPRAKGSPECQKYILVAFPKKNNAKALVRPSGVVHPTM